MGWVTINETSGNSGSTTVKITIPVNNTGKDRTATLIATTSDGSMASAYYITQKNISGGGG